MTISYEEALSTLSSMFSSQGYTSQQLDAVLRHYGGHMENCVEAILLHGDGSPDELIRKLPSLSTAAPAAAAAAASSSGGGGSHDIDADEELARQLAAEDRQQSSNNYARTTQNNARAAAARRQHFHEQRRPMASTVTAAASSPSRRGGGNNSNNTAQQTKKGRGTHTTLPMDFLRIPGRNYSSTNNNNNNGSTTAASTSGAANGMTDEQLARMLQDELFQEELRNNPEFSHLGNYYGSSRSRQHQHHQQGQQYQQQQQGPDIFDKLSELGDAARQRFQAFAAGWNNAQGNTNNSGGGGGLFGLGGAVGGGGGSPSNRGGNERRGLLSGELDMDEDEEEMDFIGGGRDVELKSVGRSGDKKTD
jgi:ribosomal protein L12E/L44/L45/RPP1/RPP2